MMPNALRGEQLSQSVVREHQRDRVLRAATEVFAKRSYPATTVDHLIGAAKVSFSTFYDLFGGKEDCFLGAYELAVASAYERIEESLPADGSPAEKVLATLRGLANSIAADQMAARLVLVEAQVAGPAPVARHEALLKDLAPRLEVLRDTTSSSSSCRQPSRRRRLAGLTGFSSSGS